MWFFKKKGKKEETRSTQGSESGVPPVDPRELLSDISCDIFCAIDELEFISRYGCNFDYIIRDLEAAGYKCSLEQVEEVYFAIDGAIRELEIEKEIMLLPHTEFCSFSRAVQLLNDAKHKCYRIW